MKLSDFNIIFYIYDSWYKEEGAVSSIISKPLQLGLSFYNTMDALRERKRIIWTKN